jgi:hypothetical protein
VELLAGGGSLVSADVATRRGRWAIGIGMLAAALAACHGQSSAGGIGPTGPTGRLVTVHGWVVAVSPLPCHENEDLVDGKVVTVSSFGVQVATTVTGQATWVGLPGLGPHSPAPHGRCRQTAPFTVRVPRERGYRVSFDGKPYWHVSFADLDDRAFRWQFRLPSFRG